MNHLHSRREWLRRSATAAAASAFAPALIGAGCEARGAADAVERGASLAALLAPAAPLDCTSMVDVRDFGATPDGDFASPCSARRMRPHAALAPSSFPRARGRSARSMRAAVSSPRPAP